MVPLQVLSKQHNNFHYDEILHAAFSGIAFRDSYFEMSSDIPAIRFLTVLDCMAYEQVKSF